eukprot:353082-Chlamydomonas_euryale.AAC.4
MVAGQNVHELQPFDVWRSTCAIGPHPLSFHLWSGCRFWGRVCGVGSTKATEATWALFSGLSLPSFRVSDPGWPPHVRTNLGGRVRPATRRHVTVSPMRSLKTCLPLPPTHISRHALKYSSSFRNVKFPSQLHRRPAPPCWPPIRSPPPTPSEAGCRALAGSTVVLAPE